MVRGGLVLPGLVTEGESRVFYTLYLFWGNKTVDQLSGANLKKRVFL